MASEDSAKLRRPATVHRRRDVSDATQALLAEVRPELHHADDFGKATEVARLGRDEWVFFEERDDAVGQVSQAADAVAPDVLSMPVPATTDRHRATPEEANECVQHLSTSHPLNNREVRLALPAERTRLVPEDGNAEASLAVDEADDPLRS